MERCNRSLLLNEDSLGQLEKLDESMCSTVIQTRSNMTLTAIVARLRKVAADMELLAAKGRSACLAGRDHKLACFQFLWGEFPSIPNGSASYFSVAYSDFAASRMGRSGSASFQAAMKSW
jgi:hypothetical protein